ncbi:MAG: GAF domain-containing protein [Bacteroidales bacterium]|nr:GAF domain-containing protein [Bacteroidales bacterium]
MTQTDKRTLYEQLLPQLAALVDGETEEMSVLANVASAIHETFGFWWTGFYLVRHGELRLGPFQGPTACMRIARGRGVCGASWDRGQTIVVPDVKHFPGHIACSSASRSEIVVPIYNGANPMQSCPSVVGVLDIDSQHPSAFDATDQKFLEQVAALITQTLYTPKAP